MLGKLVNNLENSFWYLLKDPVNNYFKCVRKVTHGIAGKGKPPKKFDSWFWIESETKNVTVIDDFWRKGFPKKRGGGRLNCMLANKNGRWSNNLCNKKMPGFVCEAQCVACGFDGNKPQFCCGGICIKDNACEFTVVESFGL